MADFYEEETDTVEAAPKSNEADMPDVETALLPKSIFEGKELTPGSKCEVEIVEVFDDEVEVKYVPHKKDSTGSHMEDSVAELESIAVE